MERVAYEVFVGCLGFLSVDVRSRAAVVLGFKGGHGNYDPGGLLRAAAVAGATIQLVNPEFIW